jgi:hypothetical protein
MSVWDEVKRSVDDISDVAKEVANLLAEKTDEISREGKLKLEIFNLQRQIRSREAKLGRMTFDLWSKDPDIVVGADHSAQEQLNAMKNLRADIETRQKELEESPKTGEKPEKKGGEESAN